MAGSTIYVTTMSVSSLTFSTVNGSGGGGIGAGQVAAIFMTPNAATTIPSNTSTIVTWGNLSNSAQNTGQTGLTYISSGGAAGSFANQTGAPIFTLIEYTLYLTAAGTNFTYIGLYPTSSTPTSIVAYGAMYPSSNWLKNSFTIGIPAGYSIAVFYQDSTSTTVQIANTTISISNIGTSGATGATGPQGAVGMASYLFGTGATGGATGATGPINTPTIIPWSNTFVAQSLSGITGLTYANGVFTNNSLAAMPLHIAYNLLLNQTGSGTTYVGINGGTNPLDTYGVQLTTVNAYSNGCTILLAVGSSFAVYHTDTVPFVVQQYASKINVTLLSVGPQGQTGYTGTTGPTGPVGQVTVLSVYPTTTQSITANTPTTLLWGSTNNSQTLGIMGLTYNAGLFTNNTGITIPLLLEYTVALNTTASGAIHVGINGGTNSFGTMLTTANIFSGSATVLLPAGQTVGLYYTDANAVIVQTGTPPSQLTQLSISLLTAGPQGSTGYTGTTGPTGPNSWTTNGLNLSYTAGMVTASTFTASTIQAGLVTTSSIRLASTVISVGQSTNQNYYNLAQSANGSTFGSTLTTTSWGSTLNTLTNVKNASMVGAGNYQLVTTGTSTLNSVYLTANNGSTWSTISQATGLPSAVSTIYSYGSMCSLGIYSLLATSFEGVSGGALYLSNNTATSYTNLTPNAIGANPYVYLPFENSIVDVRGNATVTTTGSVSYVAGQVGSTAVNLVNTAGTTATNYLSSPITLGNNFSVSLWFNFKTLPATDSTTSNIITFGGASNQMLFQIMYLTLSGYNGFYVQYLNGASSAASIYSANVISTNTWYNIVCTFQASGTNTVYLNNALVANVASSGISAAITTMRIGYNISSGNSAFNGYIDDVRIYNTAIYTGGAATLPSPYALTAAPNAPPLNTSLTAISGNAQYMLASAPSGGLYLSSNFGSTWSQVTSATSNGAWTGLAISYTGQYMVAISQTASNAPIYSTNYGSNWTQTSFTGVTGSFVAISGNGQYCLTGSTTVAFLISNYLAGFSTSAYTQPTLTGINANIVAASLSTTGQYMVIVTAGTTNNVYFSINYGATFTAITIGAAALVSCTMSYDGSYITVANATTVYTLNQNSNGYTVAVGANAGLTNQAINAIAIGNNAGTINQTANSIILNASGNALNSYAQGFYVAPIASALAGPSATYNMLAYGLDNQVVQSGITFNNSQQLLYGTLTPSWTQVTQLPSLSWYASALSYSGQYISVIANSGYIYVSSTYGQTWTQITTANGLTATNIYFTALSMSSSGQYQAAAYQATATAGSVFISSNYGQTWNLIASGSNQQMMNIAVSATGQYMILTPNYNATANIYVSSTYGQSWTSTSQQLVGSWGCAISGTGQYMLASYGNNATYLSSNYGTSWSSIASLTQIGGSYAISYTGQYMVVPQGANGIYVSSTYGQSWTQYSSYTIARSSAISSSGQYIVVTTLLGGSYISSNYGQTWTSISTGTTNNLYSNAMSGSGTYQMYVVNVGGVFLSSITTATDSFAIANNSGTSSATTYFSSTAVAFGSTTNQPLYLMSGGATNMTLLSNGNVGIGTTAPGAKLEVNGIIRSTTGYFSTYVPGSTIGADNSLLGHIGFIDPAGFAQGGFGAYIACYGMGGSGTYGAELRFYTNAFSGGGTLQRMVIDKWGYVGIGTNAPSTPLHVNGLTTLGGNLGMKTYTITGTLPAPGSGALYSLPSGVTYSNIICLIGYSLPGNNNLVPWDYRSNTTYIVYYYISYTSPTNSLNVNVPAGSTSLTSSTPFQVFIVTNS
jgi:hypothetical protein